MSQGTEHLLCKHEDLIQISRSYRKPAMVTQAYNSSIPVIRWKAGTEESRKVMGQLAWYKVTWDSILNKVKGQKQNPRLSSYFHMYTWAPQTCVDHTHIHTCTHARTHSCTHSRYTLLLAWQTWPPWVQADPLDTWTTGVEGMAWERYPVHAGLKNTHVSLFLLRPLTPLLPAQPQRGFLSCGLMACIYFKEAILILKRYLGELGTINTSFFKKFVSFFPACNLTLTGTIQIKCSQRRLPPTQP